MRVPLEIDKVLEHVSGVRACSDFDRHWNQREGSLNLSHCNIADEQMKEMVAWYRNNPFYHRNILLRSIDLSHNEISYAGIQQLILILNFNKSSGKYLTTIKLNNNRINGDAMVLLLNELINMNSKVQVLYLQANSNQFDTPEIVDLARSLRTLCDFRFDGDLLQLRFAAIEVDREAELVIDSTVCKTITDDDLKRIGAQTHLTSLTISDVNISCTAASLFRTIVKLSHLRHLTLKACEFQRGDEATLWHSLPMFTQLTHLTLSNMNNKGERALISFLTTLKNNQSLRRLALIHSHLSLQVLKTLVRTLPSCHLTQIDLSNNRFGITALPDLVTILKSNLNIDIDFRENSLPSEALIYLRAKQSKFAPNTSLQLGEGQRFLNYSAPVRNLDFMLQTGDLPAALEILKTKGWETTREAGTALAEAIVASHLSYSTKIRWEAALCLLAFDDSNNLLISQGIQRLRNEPFHSATELKITLQVDRVLSLKHSQPIAETDENWVFYEECIFLPSKPPIYQVLRGQTFPQNLILEKIRVFEKHRAHALNTLHHDIDRLLMQRPMIRNNAVSDCWQLIRDSIEESQGIDAEHQARIRRRVYYGLLLDLEQWTPLKMINYYLSYYVQGVTQSRGELLQVESFKSVAVFLSVLYRVQAKLLQNCSGEETESWVNQHFIQRVNRFIFAFILGCYSKSINSRSNTYDDILKPLNLTKYQLPYSVQLTDEPDFKEASFVDLCMKEPSRRCLASLEQQAKILDLLASLYQEIASSFTPDTKKQLKIIKIYFLEDLYLLLHYGSKPALSCLLDYAPQLYPDVYQGASSRTENIVTAIKKMLAAPEINHGR